MRALSILYGGNLTEKAFLPLIKGKNSVYLAIEQARQFPGTEKTALFVSSDIDISFAEDIQVERRDVWTKKELLESISRLAVGSESSFDCIYFAYADCPFLDIDLTGKMAERHIQYKAEYSYADGWPYGLVPEIMSAGTPGILAKILKDDIEPVERDILFSIIQKDINAFDIEAEISPIDFSCHRLNLCADTKRNFLLLKNFFEAAGKIPVTADIERIIKERPEVLRTLPAFYPIQVYGGCPQKCALCPYPLITENTSRKDFMPANHFDELLNKITAFSDDAVIDLSLWGELGFHPQKMQLIENVLNHKKLTLVIETSGIGWKEDELEKCAALNAALSAAVTRNNTLPPLSWIISLDTIDPQRYLELRGNGFAEACSTAKKLLSLFNKNCYIQAVRTKGSEDDTEKFYRYWKENASEKNIIIQKHDDFCGLLDKKQASDISPLIRKPCWHIMRDLPVLIDGTVPLCRENTNALKNKNDKYIIGNIFTDTLDKIWQNGEEYYNEHCKENYMEPCLNCDEYYTFNF